MSAEYFRFCADLTQNVKGKPPKSMPMMRMMNALYDHGFRSYAEVADTPVGDLYAISGIGDMAIALIKGEDAVRKRASENTRFDFTCDKCGKTSGPEGRHNVYLEVRDRNGKGRMDTAFERKFKLCRECGAEVLPKLLAEVGDEV